MAGRFAPAASAPGLVGSRGALVARTKSAPERPYSHVHLEVDLRHESWEPTRLPWLGRLEGILREREVVESADLLRLTAATLHAGTSLGFSRVDHWEIEPGGWLPLPEATHRGTVEPTGHLLRALESGAWRSVGTARSFAVRLSGTGPYRIDLVVRRVHRERRHALSVDLRGRIRKPELRRLSAALRERLPVLRIQVTEFSHEGPSDPAPSRPRRTSG